MKLLLHWLRWDLCRFRWMLTAWTLLVLGYAAFLGWMHADILTIGPDWMAWSGSVAMLLGITELLMLFHLFSTDPAGGVDPFWKTRPPTGFAVAGSKLVIALGFFVVLPMAAWFTMEALCVKPGAVTHEWKEGVSWTRFLWLTQTLGISVLALGAAIGRNPWEIPLKLAQGFALAVLPALLALVFKPNATGVLGLVVERAAETLVSPSAFWLWGAAGRGVFLLARWNHTPARSWRWIIAAIPCAIILVAPALPAGKTTGGTEPPRPVPDPTVAERIHVKGLSLRDGGPRYSLPRNFAKDDTYLNAIYEMKLKVSGLPDGLPASAGWRELRLTAPDGRVVEADRAAMQGMTIRDTGGMRPEDLLVKGAVFKAGELGAFSLLPCRAEGILRIMLKRQESATLRLEPGAVLETPMAWYGFPEERFKGSRWQSVLMQVPRRGAAGLRTVEFEHLASGERRGALWATSPLQSGFLMQSMQAVCNVLVSSQARDLASLRLKQEFEQGVPVKDWQLRFTWEAPDGYVDLPLVVEPFLLPRQTGDRRRLQDLIGAVPWTADAPADRVRVAVGSVLLLANQPYDPVQAGEEVEAAMEKWLSQVPAGHLPVLLDLARENLPTNNRRLVSDAVLTRRIAALISKEAAAELRRKEPALFDYLENAFLDAGLISYQSLKTAMPGPMTDRELAETWDQRAKEDQLPMDLLEEAMRRGLPWAKLVIVELMESNPYHRDITPLSQFMVRISDCPENPEKARRWLRSHAERLEWDPAAKRWVLPPPP